MPDETKTSDQVHEEHYCQHDRCRKWGSFGYDRKSRTDWFCLEHRPDRDIR
ncbi:hypothetical protein [Rhizobium halophytocola]|nr:hypothetical protein [Rhizobium halophytocola]